jgi:GDP-L-fucose synthase
MKNLLILGARGMVGSGIHRAALSYGYEKVFTPSSKELNLCNQAETFSYFQDLKPDEVIVAAAKVGGIHANNTYPAEFIYDNLMIASNSIESAYQAGVKRLLFLGSSCIYPKFAEQPMKEEALLTGSLEPTNEAYAVAKIAGMKLCQYYRKQYGVLFHSAMPTNLYGFGDNYHPENSHVIPALMRRFHESKERGDEKVIIWGTGSPKREFLHVDDLAAGCLTIMQQENPADWYNLGCGEDISIIDLAKLIAKVVGFEGEIATDPTKPDGTPRKLMDVSRLKGTGWSPKIDLEYGLSMTYADFVEKVKTGDYRAK